jgi:translation elongation factor EF-G
MARCSLVMYERVIKFVQAVSAVNPIDAQRVHEALHRIVKSDPLAKSLVDPQTNETILCGAGELFVVLIVTIVNLIFVRHVEVCLNSLRDLAGVEVKHSNPVVQFCETVTTESPVCLAKSSNKVWIPSRNLVGSCSTAQSRVHSRPAHHGRALP